MNSSDDCVARTGRLRLLIADDHVLVLDMLRSLLDREFDLLGTAASGEELVSLARRVPADIIMLDVGMPGLGGLEAAKALRGAGVAARLVFLSMESDPDIAARAFALGASAYLLKSCPAAELLRVLRLVASGGQYLSRELCGGDIEALCERQAERPMGRLSPRELEVLTLLVAGMSMKAVARRLGIVPRTVAFHKYHAMETLGLRDNADLVDFAIRQGLLGARPPFAAGGTDSPAA